MSSRSRIPIEPEPTTISTAIVVETVTSVQVMRRYSNPEFVSRLERVLSGQGRDRVSRRPVPSLPTNGTRINAEMLDRLADRYSTGETLHALATEFGVERALIAELLRARGVAVTYRITNDDDLDDAAALYASGLSLKRVGERFGVSANAVQDAFVAAGIPRRPERRRA